MDPLYWRLYYADDHVEDEPLDNASIRLSHAGALVLAACKPLPGGDREPVWKVELTEVKGGKATIFKPVWYRKRSLSLGLDDQRLDATVMGRVRDAGDKIDGTLWASLDGATFGDCPPWAEDQRAVEGLMLSA